MNVKLTYEDARALAHVNAQYPQMVLLLGRELEDTKTRLAMVGPDAGFRALQGRAQMLIELLDAFKNSPEIAAKLAANK